jgi:hypothetical protein
MILSATQKSKTLADTRGMSILGIVLASYVGIESEYHLPWVITMHARCSTRYETSEHLIKFFIVKMTVILTREERYSRMRQYCLSQPEEEILPLCARSALVLVLSAVKDSNSFVGNHDQVRYTLCLVSQELVDVGRALPL